MSHRVYYAHPMTLYGTERESEDLAFLAEEFPGSEIVNPNHSDHQAGCKHLGMAYFTELVKTCDGIVAVPFPDGEWGSGVYAEVEQMAKLRRPVLTISRVIGGNTTLQVLDFKKIRPLSIRETSDIVHGKKA